MARAARLAPAASSEASSTVRLQSWLMTDITMLIMSCNRRIFLASSSFSLRCAESSARSQVLIRPPLFFAPSFDAPAQPDVAFIALAYSVGIQGRTQPLRGVGLRLPVQPEVQSWGSKQSGYPAPVSCPERRIYERTSRRAPQSE